MDTELHRAVYKKYGKYSSIRVIHPMTTYRQGRRSGYHMGTITFLVASMLSEQFYGDTNVDLWWWVISLALATAVFWHGLMGEPNRIARSMRRSIGIYKDE